MAVPWPVQLAQEISFNSVDNFMSNLDKQTQTVSITSLRCSAIAYTTKQKQKNEA